MVTVDNVKPTLKALRSLQNFGTKKLAYLFYFEVQKKCIKNFY